MVGENKQYDIILAKKSEIDMELNIALNWISFRPVVYDEIEHFQTGVDYPFS